MTQAILSPGNAFQHLSLVADAYALAAKGMQPRLADVTDTSHAFSSGPSATEFFWPSDTKDHSVSVLIGENVHQVLVEQNDVPSNIVAIRMLFRSALSLDIPPSEEDMGKIENFAFQIDTDGDGRCIDILREHVLTKISFSRSLKELNDLISRTSIAIALSLDMAMCFKEKIPPVLLDAACDRKEALCNQALPEEVTNFQASIRKFFNAAVDAKMQQQQTNASSAKSAT